MLQIKYYFNESLLNKSMLFFFYLTDPKLYFLKIHTELNSFNSNFAIIVRLLKLYLLYLKSVFIARNVEIYFRFTSEGSLTFLGK